MKCKEAAVRGIETPVQEIRRKIFAAISKVALNQRMIHLMARLRQSHI